MRTMETCFLPNEQILLENLVRCKGNQPDLPHLLERPALSKFETPSLESVKTLITSAPSKSCENDPLPTTIAKECLNELSPAISSMINLSLEQDQFYDVLKGAPVQTKLKKSSLELEKKNYRPARNLQVLSKLQEKQLLNKQLLTWWHMRFSLGRNQPTGYSTVPWQPYYVFLTSYLTWMKNT